MQIVVMYSTLVISYVQAAKTPDSSIVVHEPGAFSICSVNGEDHQDRKQCLSNVFDLDRTTNSHFWPAHHLSEMTTLVY